MQRGSDANFLAKLKQLPPPKVEVSTTATLLSESLGCVLTSMALCCRPSDSRARQKASKAAPHENATRTSRPHRSQTAGNPGSPLHSHSRHPDSETETSPEASSAHSTCPRQPSPYSSALPRSTTPTCKGAKRGATDRDTPEIRPGCCGQIPDCTVNGKPCRTLTVTRDT